MKKFTTYAFVLALLALAACNTPKVETPQPEGEAVLSFEAPTEAVPLSESGRAGAGSTTIAASNIQNYEIALFGRYETGDNIFLNHPEVLSYVASFRDAKGATHTDQWVYGDTSKYNCGTDEEPRRPWHRLLDHEFRAFLPFNADGNDHVNGLPPENIQAMSDATKLVLNYYTQTNKFDLMVARTLRNPTKDAEGMNKVRLEFQHVLSALQFRIKHKIESTDILTEAYIDGIAASGVLYYGVMMEGDSATNIHWTPSQPSNNNYLWKGSKTIGRTDSSAAVAFDGDGVIFAIPQTIDEQQVSFVFKTQAGNTAIHRAYLPAITFEPGKKYVFTMELSGASANITVSIKEWTEVKSNQDIYIQ